MPVYPDSSAFIGWAATNRLPVLLIFKVVSGILLLAGASGLVSFLLVTYWYTLTGLLL